MAPLDGGGAEPAACRVGVLWGPRIGFTVFTSPWNYRQNCVCADAFFWVVYSSYQMPKGVHDPPKAKDSEGLVRTFVACSPAPDSRLHPQVIYQPP